MLTSTDAFDAAKQQSDKTGMEFCCSCYKQLKFSKHLHINHPRRHENGAKFVECSGQLCEVCGPKFS